MHREQLLSTNHINCAVGQRYHIEISVRSRDDVCADTEVLADDQTFALAFVKLVVVVIDQISELRIAECKVLAR